jgi:hypothetical protein
MAATYTPIASITLGAAASSVTFNSVPQTYTDLILVINAATTTPSSDTRLRFNSDTASNYSRTGIYGDGSSAISYRSSGATFIETPQFTGSVGGSAATIHIMNYSNTTTYKNALLRSGYASGYLFLQAGLWRNTAAITTIELSFASTTWVTGSTFDLYGILGANA